MAPFETSIRRLFLAGGFVLAIAAAPAISAVTVPSQGPTHQAAPLDSCNTGEEADLYTNICLPHTVPNSPSTTGFSVNAANPDIPTVDNVPCTGRSRGECVGLEQNAPDYVPPTVSVDGTPVG